MKRIHFIAIGGAIMHQLALALHQQGYAVTGSDDEINDPAKKNLANAGLLPAAIGWFPEKVDTTVDAVILGMHAKADNPELKAAQALGLPVYSFPEYVFEVSKSKKRVVIAGSHGKTTITSMVMHILKEAGLDFDYLVGAKVPGFAESVKLSDAPIIVIEGDEYPASVIEKRPKILFYHPDITLLSGIAWDHINVFPTYDNYFSQFQQYLQGLSNEAQLIYNSEDSEVVRVVQEVADRLSSTGYTTPSYQYSNGATIAEINGTSVSLAVFGRHNVQNMQGAVAVCMALGVPESTCLAAVQSFTGAAKRLEKVSASDQLLVYRDFAHAPSKLRATLNAVREAYQGFYLIACFELHTYSSLNEHFLKEYEHSMDAADKSLVFFSNHALELKGLPFLEKETVKANFRREDLVVVNDKRELLEQLHAVMEDAPKPVFLLVMSSGTFDGIDWNDVSSQLDK